MPLCDIPSGSLEDRFQQPFCIFLDRDGVINELLPGDYVKTKEDFQFRDGVLSGLSKLSEITPYIFVITNQQGIGKNLMTESDLAKVHQFMNDQIQNAGGQLTGIYHCPHLISQHCQCRKPGIGLIQQIESDFPEIIDGPKLLIGDNVSDFEVGEKIGASIFGMRHAYNREVDWTSFHITEIHNFSEFVEHCKKLISKTP